MATLNLEPAMLIQLGQIEDFPESSHGESLHLQKFLQGSKMQFSANLRKSGRHVYHNLLKKKKISHDPSFYFVPSQ